MQTFNAIRKGHCGFDQGDDTRDNFIELLVIYYGNFCKYRNVYLLCGARMRFMEEVALTEYNFSIERGFQVLMR